MKLATAAVLLALALAIGVQASPAAAQMPEGPEAAWEKTPATRRGGFTAGLALGGALGMAAGYPNDAKKIGLERYYTETGIGAGGAGAIWVGAAITDWFTFGLGFAIDRLGPSQGTIDDAGIFFRVEAFPLFPMGGLWRELGLAIETGTGGATVADPDAPDANLVDGGAPSRIGFAVFYEGLRLWKISTGPFGGANYMWSETIRRGEAVLGWRTVIYAGP